MSIQMVELSCGKARFITWPTPPTMPPLSSVSPRNMIAQHQTTEPIGVAQPADHRDVGEANQRFGDEGERGRDGDAEHIAAGHLEGESRACHLSPP